MYLLSNLWLHVLTVRGLCDTGWVTSGHDLLGTGLHRHHSKTGSLKTIHPHTELRGELGTEFGNGPSPFWTGVGSGGTEVPKGTDEVEGGVDEKTRGRW